MATTGRSEQLIELGFEVRIERESSADVAAGSVIRTEPAAGSQVDLGTEIKIFESTGTAELLLPGLLNQSEEAARLELTTRGLVPIVNYVDVDPNSGQVGIVIAQNPQGGTPLGAGSSVTINVGRAQTQETQPPSNDGGDDNPPDNPPGENDGDDEHLADCEPLDRGCSGQEVLQQFHPADAEDGLGMELHTLDVELPMA